MTVRVRFAPSPTGELHLGGARTALINALFARSVGGVLVLRIEDTDEQRNRDGAEASLENDLEWLGIVPDESPRRGGPCGPYRQSERHSRHRAAGDLLFEQGRVYACFCPATAGAAGVGSASAGGGATAERGCPGGCAAVDPAEAHRRRAAGEEAVLRFRLEPDRAIDDLLHGRVDFTGAPAPDPVIRRADGSTTFLFANAVDDAAMQITHVIRGDDHLPNGWKQAQMIRALGCRVPQFAHLPLIHGPDHKPLSKRHGPASIGALRALGFAPQAVVMALAHLGAQPPEVAPGSDPWPPLVDWFRLDRLSAAAAIHDQPRLDHLSARWWRALTAEQLAAAAVHREDRQEWFGAEPDPPWWPPLLRLTIESQSTLGAAIALAVALLAHGGAPSEEGRDVLRVWREVWPREGLTEADFKPLSKQVETRSGATGRALFHPLRVALTGRDDGPTLARLAPLIDAAALTGGGLFTVNSCLARIDAALDNPPS